MAYQTQTQTQSSESVGVLKLRSEAEASKPAARTGPLDGWWRGSRDKRVPAVRPGYPDFYDKTDKESLLKKRQWVKEHLVLSFRIWGDLGFTHGASGHITVKDPILTDHFWMNPIGVHFGDVNMSDLVLVDSEGYVTPHGAQLPINQAGFEIHSAIHRARPEAHSAAHCHSRFGRAWSVFGKPLGMNNQDSCQLYKNQGVYLDGGRVAFERSEGELIAQSLGATYKTGILQNHGLITLGETVDEACYLFNMMEKQCDIQLMIEAAKAGGMNPVEIGDDDAAYTKEQNADPEALYYEHQADIEHFRRRFPQALTA